MRAWVPAAWGPPRRSDRHQRVAGADRRARLPVTLRMNVNVDPLADCRPDLQLYANALRIDGEGIGQPEIHLYYAADIARRRTCIEHVERVPLRGIAAQYRWSPKNRDREFDQRRSAGYDPS